MPKKFNEHDVIKNFTIVFKSTYCIELALECKLNDVKKKKKYIQLELL